MELGISGRTALVCASTSGLGRAVAELLAHEGANVVVCGRRAELARDIAAQLPVATGIGADLLAPGGPTELVRQATAAFGPIDILVLNGPGPRPAPVTDIEAHELGEAVDSLLTAHHRLLSLTLPHMRRQRWGRVLAIGSSAVVSPIGDLALSGIGRTALAAYLKMLATDVAENGVTVNMLLPGRIATHRVEQLDAARAARSGRDIETERAKSAGRIPMKRYGSPEEFARCAAFLCSDAAAYVTGTALRCDGGQSPIL
ncbi:SDR family oxidoreductase [Kitasatospora sp. NPDC057542]|uniref:SDR family oxidoreductase n=1 Tax=Streptomycetaceae TaxID=2062 RepID=UPI001CCAAF53|nr:SDR family oxidoreductase [Streptomyces sp. LS1784]